MLLRSSHVQPPTSLWSSLRWIISTMNSQAMHATRSISHPFVLLSLSPRRPSTSTIHSPTTRKSIGSWWVSASESVPYIWLTPSCQWAVFHPQHKLAYFRNSRWPNTWIKTAEEVVHEEFERSYAKDDSEGSNETAAADDSESDEMTRLSRLERAMVSAIWDVSLLLTLYWNRLIFLTIYQPLHHPWPLSWALNLTDTSSQTFSMSSNQSHGGTRTMHRTLNFPGWQLII